MASAENVELIPLDRQMGKTTKLVEMAVSCIRGGIEPRRIVFFTAEGAQGSARIEHEISHKFGEYQNIQYVSSEKATGWRTGRRYAVGFLDNADLLDDGLEVIRSMQETCAVVYVAYTPVAPTLKTLEQVEKAEAAIRAKLAPPTRKQDWGL